MALPYASLEADGKAATQAANRVTHHRRVEAIFYRKLTNKVVTSLTNVILSGAVKGENKRTPCTYLEMQLLDVDRTLDWTNGEHQHYDVKIIDSIFVPALNDWVEWSVFRGPIWDFSRTDQDVSITAEDAAKNAQGSIRRKYDKPAKTRAVVVARDLLTLAGARKADLLIPTGLKATLPKAVTVGVKRGERRDTNGKAEGMGKDNRKTVQRFKANGEDTYYDEVRKIAEAVNRDFYVDGEGRFCWVSPKSRPSIYLDETVILAPVTEKRVADGELPNVWEVKGKEYDKRKQPFARVELPKSHNASPRKAGWNGTDRERLVRIENSQIRNNKQARELARKQRDRSIRESVVHEVSCVPCVGYIRPFSLASFPVNGGRATGQVPEWTYPLSGNDPMVLGAIRRRGAK